MEIPGDTTDDVPVKSEAKNHMETLGDTTDDVPAQSDAANYMDTSRTTRKVWHWNRIYPRGELRPKQIRYTGEEKILQQLPRNPTSEDFFKLYITGKIIDEVVTQTNLYARQYHEKEKDNLEPNSTAHQWKPTDRAEMLTFLGLLMLMGIVHKPRLTMYWSRDNIMATPIFNQVMRRDRFPLLLRFLHFADNSQYSTADPDRDKLYKLRNVINMIKESCRMVYSPEKSPSLDESLVLFKERLSFKQYINTKRPRFGLQVVSAVHIWHPARFHCLSWQFGTRISKNRRRLSYY